MGLNQFSDKKTVLLIIVIFCIGFVFMLPLFMGPDALGLRGIFLSETIMKMGVMFVILASAGLCLSAVALFVFIIQLVHICYRYIVEKYIF